MTTQQPSDIILIVDDEPEVCQSIQLKLLRLPRFSSSEVITAGGTVEALCLFEQYHPNIVLTDIHMPGLNGFTLMDEIRRKSPSCKIFAVSGYDDFEFVRKAFLIGVDDYILKPVSLEELNEKIYADKTALIESRTEKSEKLIIKTTLLFMQENINRHITLKDAADNVKLSYTYFSKLFHDETGESFSACLLRMRMERGKLLILDTSVRVGEIAAKLGYEDQNHFSRDFKRYTGLSPSEYRNLL